MIPDEVRATHATLSPAAAAFLEEAGTEGFIEVSADGGGDGTPAP